MIDLKNNLKFITAVAPYNPTATGTTSGDVLDTAPYDSVTLAIQAGAQTTTGITVTPVVLSGTVSTSFASAADSALLGTEAAAALELAGSAGAKGIGTVGYVGANRYVKARLILTAAHTGYYGATWVCRPKKLPATQ